MKRMIKAGGRRLEYILIQSVRQNMLFQVLPEGVPRVYAPKYMRLRDIDEMVCKQAEALLQMQRDVDRRLEENRRIHPVTEGSAIFIEGVPCVLHLHAGERIAGVIADGEFHLTLPRPDSDPDVRAAIRSVLSARALECIRSRLAFYVPRIGRTPGRVTVRDQKSRWGSCSSKGNLNFNWKLIMAPPQALDYVVIHELCHLYEFNHSPRFWQRVQQQMPDYASWKKWLKVHGEDLFL